MSKNTNHMNLNQHKSNIEHPSYKSNKTDHAPEHPKTAIQTQNLFDEINKKLTNEDYSPTIKLSRFGIKTPTDFKILLGSPAGKSLIERIAKKLALEQAIKEDRQFEARQRALRIARIKAFLFLCFIEEKAHAFDKIRDFINQENEKAIERAKPAETRAKASPAITNTNVDILELTKAYNKAVEEAQLKMTEGERLENQLDQILLQKLQLDSKYATFQRRLEDLEQSYNDYSILTPVELEATINEHFSKIEELLLSVQMALEHNEDHKAILLGQEINGINLFLAVLRDMSAVRENQKFYADALGNEITSYKDAEMILAHGDKVLKHNNKLYLVKVGEDWDQIKENARSLEKAHHNLIEAKSINKLVIHNKELEYNFNSKRQEDIKSSITSNFADQMTIANQVNQLAALRANVSYDTKQADADQTSPAPRLTPSFSNKTSAEPQVKKSSSTATIKAELEQLRNNKSATYQDILVFDSKIPAGEAKNTLASMLPNLPRTGPIPDMIMQNLLQNMARFGVDPYKPSVTAARTPSADKAEERQYPTPFKTTPY